MLFPMEQFRWSCFSSKCQLIIFYENCNIFPVIVPCIVALLHCAWMTLFFLSMAFIYFFFFAACIYNVRRMNITKTSLFKYTENFTTKKWKFSDKNSDFLYISAQNIDCGYWLELPHWGGTNEYPQSMFLSRNKKSNVVMYTIVNPSFTV